MQNLHYMDGAWYTTQDLKISAFDLSVLRGYGVFDFLRTYNHKPFHLEPHLDRLFNSAKILGLSVEKTAEEIESIVAEGIEKNKEACKDFNIRIVVTGGVGSDSTTPGKPSFIVMFTPAIEYPQEFYTKGVKIITYPYMRSLPDAKTLNYLIGIKVLQEAKKQNAVEVVYRFDDDKMYEGTTSNFYTVTKGAIKTPKLDILPGITRKVIFELAEKLSIPIEETDVFYKDLDNADEAFITASNKEVMPVVMVDDKTIGDGKVGPITSKLISEYRKLI